MNAYINLYVNHCNKYRIFKTYCMNYTKKY